MPAPRRARARAVVAGDWPWPTNRWATTDHLKPLVAALSNVLGKEFREVREELSSRISELEARVYTMETTQLKHRGTWRPGTYNEGSLVAHAGSMWVARSVTSERPGNGATAWLLTVKKGRG